MNQAPPGWYHAQGDPPNTQRYWDGNLWQGDPTPVTQQVPNNTGFAQPNLGGPVNRSLIGERIGAKFIDIFAVVVPLLIIEQFLTIFLLGSATFLDTSSTRIGIGFWVITAFIALLRGGAIIAYTYFTQVKMSATLGKKVFGIKVVNEAGQNLSPAEVVKRITPHSIAICFMSIPIVGFFVAFIFLLYYVLVQPIMAAVGDFRTLRDSVTKTRVVKA